MRSPRSPAALLVAGAVLLTAAVPASASAESSARATFPRATPEGAGLTVTVRVVRRATATRAVLQQRVGRRWSVRAAARITSRTRRLRLRWRPTTSAPRVTLRVALRRGKRTLFATRARSVSIRRAPAQPPAPQVSAAAPPPSASAPPNPLAGRRIHLNLESPAVALARDLRAAGRHADAALIDKIATTPNALWLGDWTGEDPGPVVRRYVTAARAATALPLFAVYRIPGRDCGHYSGGGAADAAAYRAWIDALDRALTGPAALVLEPDALALLGCRTPADQQQALDLIRYAAATLSRDPARTIYLDAGNSSWHPEALMAMRLRAAGVDLVRGFSLNVANYRWTHEELAYGSRLATALGGDAHFVVDTSRNGRGATPDGHFCNPPGRGLGPRPTTDTGNAQADALLWIKAPGESDGPCNGGPPAGHFWPEGALALARNSAW
jgi:endoglucanase